MARGKRRWSNKLGGTKRAWICKNCGCAYCDPLFGFPDTIANRKIDYRIRNKLCIGCGKKECQCKNTNRGWKDKP